MGKAELRLEAADLLHEPPALGEEAQDLPVHPVHLFAEGLDALVHGLFYGPPALRVSSGLLGPLPFREAGHQDGDPVEDEEGPAHDEEETTSTVGVMKAARVRRRTTAMRQLRARKEEVRIPRRARR